MQVLSMSLVTNPKVQLCQSTPKNLTQAMYVSCRRVCTSYLGLRSAFWICQCRRQSHNIPKEMPIFIITFLWMISLWSWQV